MMTVQDLIDALSKVDPRFPVSTHANNHTYSWKSSGTHGPLRAVLENEPGKECVLIGNIGKRWIKEGDEILGEGSMEPASVTVFVHNDVRNTEYGRRLFDLLQARRLFKSKVSPP